MKRTDDTPPPDRQEGAVRDGRDVKIEPEKKAFVGTVQTGTGLGESPR